jgi:phage recombination protein Bet
MSAEIVESRYGLSREKVDLLKRTIAKGTSDDELELFCMTAKRLGLDPFAKQIYAIKRGSAMTIQVGIDGFRAVAARTGMLDGQEGPYWCGEDGNWKDVWLGDKPPSASKVMVYRKNCAHPFTGVANYSGYAQQSNQLWRTMGPSMIAKCAESLALRKAFPNELSGVYAPEEMDQADVRQHALPSHASPGRAIELGATASKSIDVTTYVVDDDGEGADSYLSNAVIAMADVESADDLKAMASKFTDAPKSVRVSLNEAYKNRMKFLRSKEAQPKDAAQ